MTDPAQLFDALFLVATKYALAFSVGALLMAGAIELWERRSR